MMKKDVTCHEDIYYLLSGHNHNGVDQVMMRLRLTIATEETQMRIRREKKELELLSELMYFILSF